MSGALLLLLIRIIDLYTFIVFAWVIASWLISFNIIDMRHPTVRSIISAIGALVEPVIRPIRKILPSVGGLDFSPIVLLFGLWFLRDFMINVANGRIL